MKPATESPIARAEDGAKTRGMAARVTSHSVAQIARHAYQASSAKNAQVSAIMRPPAPLAVDARTPASVSACSE